MHVVWLLLFGCVCLCASCQSDCAYDCVDACCVVCVLGMYSFVCVQVVGVTAWMHVVSSVCCGCVHLFGYMWRGS